MDCGSQRSGLPGIRATIFAAGVVLMLSSCGAIGGRKVELPVPTEMPSVQQIGRGRTVSLVRPSDERSTTSEVARDLVAEFSGSDYIPTYASSRGSVPVWIGNSIATGLEAAGYRVEKVTSLSASPTPLTLTIAVKEVRVDLGASTLSSLGRVGRARVIVTANLYNRGQRVMQRTYGGSSEQTASFIASESMSRDLLESAIKDMLRKAIPDLAAAIARESA